MEHTSYGPWAIPCPEEAPPCAAVTAQGRGSLRRTSCARAPATRTPVPATFVAAWTAPPIGPPVSPSRAPAEGSSRMARADFGAAAGACLRDREVLRRAGLAAAASVASALRAAAPAAAAGRPASRFLLRLPGRECGRFPRTPPSPVVGRLSAIGGQSSPGCSGYSGRQMWWLGLEADPWGARPTPKTPLPPYLEWLG
jgi:hypothetical protein